MARLKVRLCLIVGLVVSLSIGSTAWGMTIALIRDEALVDHAPVIVVGQVEGRLPSRPGAVSTTWLFRIHDELKGPGLASAISVELPGGRAPDGSELYIPGIPQLKPGARLLLFLYGEQAGVHRVFQAPQGIFFRTRSGNRVAALQNLSEVNVLSGRGRRNKLPLVRDFDGFTQWIQARVLGTNSPSDYRFKVTRPQLRAMTQQFNLFVQAGRNLRWPVFDSGGAVAWRNNGLMAELPSGGADEFFRALRVWENERTTPVRLTYVGASTATGGLGPADGQNVILFGDPNSEVEDIVCGEGGTLAMGGARSRAESSTFNGRLFWAISEGDIVVNNGLECLLGAVANRSRYVERVLAHELGHTLGIFHSSENRSEPNARLRDALMYYLIFDGDTRGATINSDDVAALQALYRRGRAAPPPPGPGNCPIDTMCLLNGRFRVTATWENQFNGASGVAHVPRQNRALPATFYNLSGFMYFDDPNNIELIVKVLDFGTQVKVFYSQLTNLRFTITVTDTRTGQVKTYSNTAGDCGGFDDAGFPSGAAATIEKSGTPRPRTGRSVRGTCRADADTMCLLNNRFEVEMSWRNQFNNTSGVGIPTQLSNLTGAFAFTSRANLETLVKVLEFPDRFLVLYGALSNLEYQLRIRDTITGAVETYSNPAGRYCGGLDSNAF